MKAARFELVFLIISVLAGIAAVISPTNHIGIARAKTNKAYPYPYPSPTIIVTNTNNSGTGSLRQAILDSSNGDTIIFAPSLAGQTIRLQSTLTVDKNITIDASALSEKVILSGDSDNDGDGDILIMNIFLSKHLTISNLTFTKGSSSSGTNPGAIENLGHLEIFNSIFISNSGVQGGSIRNSQYLLVENSSFTNNIGNGGGAILNNTGSEVSIKNSIFSDNQAIALNLFPGGGGAIINLGDGEILNSSFNNNFASNLGGVIVNGTVGVLTISGSTFTGNSTNGDGGAINNTMGTVVINNNSEFKENSSTSSDGGAISNSGQLIIDNSSFSENQANFGEGGAVANFSTGTISITNSSISANTSMYGAGIINEGNTTITSTEIKMNSASHGGGGILNGLEGNGSLSFINGTISGNSAPYGGGVFNLSNNGSVTLANCSITGNTATNSASGHGGGVSNFVKITINNCTIANNSAQHYGGGIFSTGSLIVNNSTVSNNSALTSGGIEFYGEFSLRNSIIANSLTGKDCFSSGGTIVQNINNLIEDNAISPNQCGTPILTSNPNLAPLANNGGTTQTMALLTNSPAINAGDDNTCETADQRGVPRPQGSHCDLGAFEYQDLIAPLVTSIIRTSTSPSSSTVDFTVTFSESVQNVDVNDFSLTTTGVTGVSITGVTPVSALVYTVSVNTGSGNGTIRLNVPSTATIKDLSDNDLSGLPFSSGEVYTISKSTTSIAVTIGGVNQGTYTLAPGESSRVNYPTVDAGPVKIESTNDVPIIAALREAYYVSGQIESFVQLMGLPAESLSTTYYFPAYNNVSLDDQLRFGNVGNAATTVTVTIAGVVRGTYNLNPGEAKRVNYAGLDAGPVVVQSSGGVPIIAALRDAYYVDGRLESFAQLMGLPQEKLSTKYYFPAYNNVSLDGQLRFGNVGNASTTVTVTIAGVVRGTYNLNPNESKRVNYAGLDAGPVVVESSGGVPITAALRDAYFVDGKLVSFIQLMGLPQEQLSTTYNFPAYNNVSLDGQLRFGNVGNIATTVTVTIAGVVRGTYTLNPSEAKRVNYVGLDAGPVVIQSSGGVPIIAALRDAYFVNGKVESFAQLMGLPQELLSSAYYFPAYNNVSLDGQLRFGVP